MRSSACDTLVWLCVRGVLAGSHFPWSPPFVLPGRGFQAIDVTAVGVFDFAASFAVFRAEQVAEDGDQPGGHVRSRLERIDVGYGAQERFLHEIVRAIDVAAE